MSNRPMAMDNQQKLIDAFSTVLTIPPDRVTDVLAYQEIVEWDSVGHMALVAELEHVFEIMLDTDDIIAMSSVAAARGILRKYGVAF